MPQKAKKKKNISNNLTKIKTKIPRNLQNQTHFEHGVPWEGIQHGWWPSQGQYPDPMIEKTSQIINQTLKNEKKKNKKQNKTSEMPMNSN